MRQTQSEREEESQRERERQRKMEIQIARLRYRKRDRKRDRQREKEQERVTNEHGTRETETTEGYTYLALENCAAVITRWLNILPNSCRNTINPILSNMDGTFFNVDEVQWSS